MTVIEIDIVKDFNSYIDACYEKYYSFSTKNNISPKRS